MAFIQGTGKYIEPEFYSDRDSFILTLKNLNYKKGAEKGAETRKAMEVANVLKESMN
jgi:hypothetical protein